MICPNCRHSVEDGSTFCPHCDYNFLVASSVTASRPKQKKQESDFDRKTKQIVLSVVLLVVAIFIVTPYMNKFKNNESESNSTPATTTTATKEETFEPLQISEEFTMTEFRTDRSLLSVKVEGAIKNTSNKDYSFVSISFAFYDDEGNKIDDKSDIISGLKAGETWKFEITGPSNADRVECSGFNAL